MVLGGISGSGAADAAAVAAVMLPAMLKQGYPRPLLREPDRRGGLDRRADPALHPLHRLCGAGARRVVPALFLGGLVPGRARRACRC
jgi:hypothetical protein